MTVGRQLLYEKVIERGAHAWLDSKRVATPAGKEPHLRTESLLHRKPTSLLFTEPGQQAFQSACHALSSFSQPHKHICWMKHDCGSLKNLETLQQPQMRPNPSCG